MESAASWEEWEKGCAAQGEVVKALKTGGGEKDAVDAAVAELLHRKKGLTEALNAAIAAAPDEATAEALSLAEKNGLDRDQVMSMLNSTIFDCLIRCH